MAETPEPIMISALEHYNYCPRQCALIHVKQVWDENLYTLRGRDLHRHADEAGGRVAAQCVIDSFGIDRFVNFEEPLID